MWVRFRPSVFRLQSHVKLFLRIVATIKGGTGIKIDTGFLTFLSNKQFTLLFVIK